MSSGGLEMEHWREIFFRDNKLIPMMFSIKSSNFFFAKLCAHTTYLLHKYNRLLRPTHFPYSLPFQRSVLHNRTTSKNFQNKENEKKIFSFDIAVLVLQSKKHKNKSFKMSMKTKAKIKYEKIRLRYSTSF